MGLLGKHQRHTQGPGHRVGNGDAGGFDGQHLGNVRPCKAPQEFFTQLFDQRDIHLVIQKAVHLQHIAGLYNAVR